MVIIKKIWCFVSWIFSMFFIIISGCYVLNKMGGSMDNSIGMNVILIVMAIGMEVLAFKVSFWWLSPIMDSKSKKEEVS